MGFIMLNFLAHGFAKIIIGAIKFNAPCTNTNIGYFSSFLLSKSLCYWRKIKKINWKIEIGSSWLSLEFWILWPNCSKLLSKPNPRRPMETLTQCSSALLSFSLLPMPFGDLLEVHGSILSHLDQIMRIVTNFFTSNIFFHSSFPSISLSMTFEILQICLLEFGFGLDFASCLLGSLYSLQIVQEVYSKMMWWMLIEIKIIIKLKEKINGDLSFILYPFLFLRSDLIL